MSIETTNKIDMGFTRVSSEFQGAAQEPRVLAGNQVEQGRISSVVEQIQESREAQEQKQIDAKEIESAVDNMNELLQVKSRQLQFQIDDDTNRTVVSVLDQESGETIRQIPSEDVLRLIARMRESGSTLDGAVGVLIDSQI